MRTIWISLCASLIIAFVDAQLNLNSSKPIVNLENLPRPPTWQQPPEERRKLSIFPRNNQKFVVTAKTVLKTEEKAVGLPTKRPVMRKFVVQDKNEKGAWYFAPREPLMKAKRFTVTVAPIRYDDIRDNSNSKPYSEKVVESKKVKNFVNHSKNEGNNKVQINKGNLINVWQNLTTSKGFKPVDKVVVQEVILNKHVGNSASNNYAKKETSSVNSDSKNAMTIVHVTEINHELEDEMRSIEVNQSFSPLNIKDMLTETVEGRSSYFNDMELIDNIKNNLKIKASLNERTNDSLNLDIPKLFTEKVINDTENLSVITSARDLYISIANHTTTNDSIEDKPRELDMRPNNFYEVKSLDNVTLSEIDDLNIKDHLNENSENAFITDGLESLMEYIESDLNTDDNARDVIGDKAQAPIKQDLDKGIFKDFTGEPVTITIKVNTSTFEPIILEPDLNGGPQTEPPSEFVFDNVENSSTERNSLNSKETHEPSSDISDDLMHEQANISDEVSQEVIIDKLNNLTSGETSNGSSVDNSNNFTGEEVSSEFIADNLSNLTGEDILNESNMDGEEISNESPIGILSEEIFDETLVDKSNKDFSNESTKEEENMSAEEIPIEAVVNRYKRSNNIIVEENQATTVTSFKYTGQPTRLSQDLSFKNINA